MYSNIPNWNISRYLELINSLPCWYFVSWLGSTWAWGLLKVFGSPIKTLVWVKSSKLTQGMTTGNKSFIMLDRWNKPSHDSSNSTIGIFTHTKDICNPLQCKHMIQRHFWMLENKPIYPPKMKHNKPAFFRSKIPACTIKGSLTEHF